MCLAMVVLDKVIGLIMNHYRVVEIGLHACFSEGMEKMSAIR